jgi:hypothetical protein
MKTPRWLHLPRHPRPQPVRRPVSHVERVSTSPKPYDWATQGDR